MAITPLSKNKTSTQLQSNLFADVHEGGGVTIRHVYGHILAIGFEGEQKLLEVLLNAQAARAE